MPDGQVLEFSGVSKHFGAVAAVSNFSARVEPGVVTGFLGPNGAGKTTSLRILLGLVRATEGVATIGGVPYSKLRHPLQTVGAVLEASSFHPGRTAANHLKVYAQAAGLAKPRVDEALATVGLAEVAGRKVGGFSLGMRQRLGLAYALLGDPGVLVLDEPSNGLDPEGIKWMRSLLRQLAAQGRTVFVSSHLLAEVQQTVDCLLIISQGRLVFQGGIEDLADPSEQATVVDAPDRAALTAALQAAGIEFETLRSGLNVRGVDTVQVGQLAADAGIALSTLQRRGPGLEEIFFELVNGVRVHESAGAVAAPEADSGAVVRDEGAEEPAAEEREEELDAAGTGEPEPVAEPVAEPEVAAEPEPAAHATFTVGGTGVIDADPGEEATETTTPAGESRGFAVASTGVIEVVTAEAAAEGDDAAAPDADQSDTDEPDTDEPDAGEAARTESDIEADRFFAAFDAPAETDSSAGGEAQHPDPEAPEPEATATEEGEQR